MSDDRFTLGTFNFLKSLVLSDKSALIRKLLLTPDQVLLVKYINRHHGNHTAAQLSSDRKISIQNASAKLKRLHEAGYIGMSERSAATGGIEKVYYNKDHCNGT